MYIDNKILLCNTIALTIIVNDHFRGVPRLAAFI